MFPLLSRSLAFTALAASLAMTQLARAEEPREVVIRMKGGGFQVSGQLRSFDGQKYVVETAQFGRLTLQAARYECVGAACSAPIATAAWTQEQLTPNRAETFSIRGGDLLAHQVIPQLVRGYAAEIGADVVHVIGPKAGEVKLRIIDKAGRDLATIDIVREDATAALAALARGETAMALTDRPATPQEADAIAAGQPKLKAAQHEHYIGLDGVAFAVAPDHPLSTISLDTAAKIFSGQITDWYELGLPPGPIKLRGRDAGSGTLARFEALVMKPRTMTLAQSIERSASESELADEIARDRNAIGLLSLGLARSAKLLSLEMSCGLTLRPTAVGVRSGEYPLSQRLYLYASAPPRQAAARGLLAYATSGEAALPAIEGISLAQSIETASLPEQSERMAHAINAQGEAFDISQMRGMLADLKGARRLSLTFRFTPGTLELDARSRLEVSRLAGLMLAPEYAGKKLLLAGFTDLSGGKFQANAAASARRSAQVRTAVLKAAGERLDQRLVTAKGYGPLAPVACNDQGEGQRLNRRVEVWIKD